MGLTFNPVALEWSKLYVLVFLRAIVLKERICLKSTPFLERLSSMEANRKSQKLSPIKKRKKNMEMHPLIDTTHSLETESEMASESIGNR